MASHSEQVIDVRVRFGDLKSGAEDLGFEQSDSGWALHGEDVSPASRTELAAGTMLAGVASTRLYEHGVYRALADEARCVVAGKTGRVIELHGFVDDAIVRDVCQSSSFLAIRR